MVVPAYDLMKELQRGRNSKAYYTKQCSPGQWTGQESFESYAKRHRDILTGALDHARDWQGLHEVLKAHGLGIKPHGNGLVIKDLHGDHAAKASAVGRSLSAKRLQERLGEFQPYRSLRQIEELSRYQAAPLHRSPERGELFAQYRAGIETRKTRLEAVKEKEDRQIAAIRQEWTAKRREIENMSIHKRNRRNLLALARKREAEAVAKTKLEFQPEREAVRREIPYTSWQDFLKLEAGNGNEVALAVLRSRKEAIEPETAPEQGKPTKDWSHHGQDYAVKTTIRAEYAEKERELQERQDLSAKGKKQLQAFLRMEQITEEARAQGQDIGKVTHRIDGKGVVIFTLASGGSIRDTGKELLFSVHDKTAEEMARKYAAKKWGKAVQIKENRLCQEITLREKQRDIGGIERN